MIKLNYHRKTLQLKESFNIAYGNYAHRNVLLVTLSANSKTGYGECIEIDYYNVDLEDCQKKLEEYRSAIEQLSFIHPQEFYLHLKSMEMHPFLRAALDCAYWDLYGKINNKSFQEMMNFYDGNCPKSSYTISIGDIDDQVQKIEESHWPILKVKVNGFSEENVARLLSTSKKIALDANASFNREEVEWLQNHQLSSGLLYVEQPLQVSEYQYLSKNKNAFWMADEDVQNGDNLDDLAKHYQAINIKIQKCGGLTPALELAKKAQDLGLKIMIGCMTESSVGISAACAIAPIFDFADLDGAALIANDYAEGSKVVDGTILISEKPGLGISLKD